MPKCILQFVVRRHLSISRSGCLYCQQPLALARGKTVPGHQSTKAAFSVPLAMKEKKRKISFFSYCSEIPYKPRYPGAVLTSVMGNLHGFLFFTILFGR